MMQGYQNDIPHAQIKLASGGLAGFIGSLDMAWWASAASFIYVCCLLANFVWLKVLRPYLEATGRIKRKRGIRTRREDRE